ncbi:MAG: hypothetical protein HQM13_04240 [SAR324 cluster bacterium]|nr:hypothetical protein [SAR324 cluster bacterium]
MNIAKAVSVRTFSNEMSARIAAMHLEALGIESVIQKDDCGGVYPQLQLTAGVELLVAPAEMERVDSILSELENETASDNEFEEEKETNQGSFVFLSGLLLGILFFSVLFFALGGFL